MTKAPIYPELLAPAGSFEKEQYAFAYGADAVYAGVPMFSLRARENQFAVNEVKEAIAYARKLKKKIYLTTNIYAHNIKVKPFLTALDEMVKLKPDAFIMSDPGLIMLAREKYPEIVIHLSTQANTVSWAQARFWYQYLGVQRIILSRELTLSEIAEIHKQVPEVELEVFVHGSICVAYSGRCLLSSYFTGRDPNQGVCAHSCRWQYQILKEKETKRGEYIRENYQEIMGQYYLEEKERPGELLPIDEDEYGTYIMNSRDLCAIEYLRDLMGAGVISFKIEGRSKTLNYLATVVKTYRQAIDLVVLNKKIPKTLFNELTSVSNRGYIPGFLIGNLQDKAQEYTAQSYQTHLFVGVIRKFDNKKQEVEIEMKNRIDLGEEIEFMMPGGSFTQTVQEMWYADDPKREKLGVAHGGHKNVVLKVDKKVSEFALVRKISS
jgi:putative protease